MTGARSPELQRNHGDGCCRSVVDVPKCRIASTIKVLNKITRSKSATLHNDEVQAHYVGSLSAHPLSSSARVRVCAAPSSPSLSVRLPVARSCRRSGACGGGSGGGRRRCRGSAGIRELMVLVGFPHPGLSFLNRSEHGGSRRCESINIKGYPYRYIGCRPGREERGGGRHFC
jgi:hypothetical protein